MDKDFKATVNLKIRFQMMHDETLYQGALVRLGAEEIVFRARQKVRVGNYVKILIPSEEEDLAEDPGTPNKVAFAEITRANRVGQVWELTSFFVDFTPPDFDQESRRRHERYAVDLIGRYQRYSHTEKKSCHIVDLSRGGVCFTTDEPFKPYNEVSLVILPQKRGLVRVMMETRVLVLRSVHTGKGIYETSGPFTNVIRKEASSTESENPETLLEEEGEAAEGNAQI